MSLILAESKIGKHICVLFFRNNKDKINNVNLVESSATLARALWYLEENSLVHSNIRCRSVTSFTLQHSYIWELQKWSKEKKCFVIEKMFLFPQKYFRLTSRLGRFNSETRRCGNPRLLRSGRDSFSCHRNVHFSQLQKLHDQGLINKF